MVSPLSRRDGGDAEGIQYNKHMILKRAGRPETDVRFVFISRSSREHTHTLSLYTYTTYHVLDYDDFLFYICVNTLEVCVCEHAVDVE